MKFGVSQSVLRKEDLRLLTGQGRYLDDVAPRDAAHVAFLRSPVAHARITGLDTAAALDMPGVIAVYTAADFAGRLVNSVDFDVVQNRDGSDGAAPLRPVLAEDTVRYAGEAVAMVVAETRAAALDAAEQIVFDTEDLPVHLETAVGGPQIHAEAPRNLAYDWAFGDAAATEAAFAAAAHTTRLDLIDNRVIANSMEPRGAFAEWDGARLHVAFSGQGVWDLKAELADKLGLAREQVRVTTPDVGGGFGIKGFNYPEYFAVAFAARELGRPVHWMSGRGEAMLTDNGGRDHVTVAEAAFDAGHRLTAIRVDCVSNLGAYNSPYGQYIASDLALKVLPGVYDVQTARFTVRGVFTNTTPVDAYRGAGRPEAIYVIERLMDWSARQLGLDPVELRRKNFIPRGKFPYQTVSGELYDVGDFDRVLDRALREADVAGFPARRAASAKSGRLRGIGLSYYIESILGDTQESTRIEFAEDGFVDLCVGTQSNGQGHETVYAQFLHQRAGIPFDRVRFVQGDTDRIPAAAEPAARARSPCRATRSTRPPTR
jgi:aerobic carbon-monoxide dehydrogenase large subunit